MEQTQKTEIVAILQLAKGLGDFQQDSEQPISFFKTAGFNRSPTRTFPILPYFVEIT
jgi:hypothetical protein